MLPVVGAVIWVVVAVGNFAVQLIVVSQWPVPYVLAEHTVSDLGYTSCLVEQRPGGELATCSPWHRLFNVAGVVQYLALGVGAVLLRRLWDGRVLLTAGFVVIAVGGVAVSLVPGDVNIAVHLAFAVPVFLGELWVLVLAAGWLRRRRPVLAAAAFAAAVLSVAGLVWLVVALGGAGNVGYAERLAAETFYLWILLVGLHTGLAGWTGGRVGTDGPGGTSPR